MIAPLAAVYGYASTELQEVSERCVLLAERLGRPRVTVNALVALWGSRFVQGRAVRCPGDCGQNAGPMPTRTTICGVTPS